MCRYALNNYKQTWSCFKCRKSFKKTGLIDFLAQSGSLEKYQALVRGKSKNERLLAEERYKTTADQIESVYRSIISKCPECGDVMANMGMDFKSPKASDLKGWKIIEGMYRIGAIYQTCGCEGFGYVPASRSDYICYLIERRDGYLTKLREVELSDDLNAFERSERAVFWAKCAENVQQVLDET